jgi:streptogramin lyase
LEARWLVLLLAFLFPVLGQVRCSDDPPPYDPSPPSATERILTYAGVLHLGGSGFGTEPGDGESFYVEILCPGSTAATIRCTDERVSIWRDDLIEIRDIPGAVRSGCSVTVYAEKLPVSGADEIVIDEVRSFTSHPLPVSTSNFMAHPLSIAFDDVNGAAYLHPEYDMSIYRVTDPGDGVRRIAVPRDTSAGGIFFGVGQGRVPHSALGEEVLIEQATGAVWFSEGGAFLYSGSELNASRINRYDPAAGEFRCWNVPANNAQVMGLFLEEASGRMWAALSAFGEAGALVSFLPETFAPTQTPCDHPFAIYDDESGYPAGGCSAGEEAGCFTFYPLPPSLAETDGSLRPSHLVMDATGDVWVTAFFGGGLVRLDRATGNFTFYPFPPARGVSAPALEIGSGPWEIVLDASERYLFVTEYFDAQILRFDLELAEAVDCTTLDASGENPCLTEYSVPVDTEDEYVHSLLADDAETLYFTVSTGNAADGDARIGRLVVNEAGAELLLFPPLATALGSTTTDAASGIALDPESGSLFVANANNRSIDVLRPLGRSFTTHLDGNQEVPVTGSPGRGMGVLTFDTSRNLLSWNITFGGLTSPRIAAYFHGPAPPGANAGPQLDIGAISGLSSPLIGTATISEAQANDLLAGLWSVNIHTIDFPEGEIRGQVGGGCGDVNADVVVDLADGLLVGQFGSGLRACGWAPFVFEENCDVAPPPSGDGSCNIGDALRISQCTSGLIPCHFACTPYSCSGEASPVAARMEMERQADRR